jgi:hypothetical protein
MYFGEHLLSQHHKMIICRSRASESDERKRYIRLVFATRRQFVMERTWTDTTRLEWIKRRDIYRKQKDLPPLESLRTSDNPVDRKSYETALSLERRSLIDRLDAYSTKTASWPVSQRPFYPYYCGHALTSLIARETTLERISCTILRKALPPSQLPQKR